MTREHFYLETTPLTQEGTLAALLLHRAGSSTGAWRAQLEALGSRRRLIALDLPGHGRAPGPPLGSIEEMAAHAERLLDRLGLERVVLAGHSLGGAVALALALRSPERVASALLISSGAKLRVARAILESIRTHFDMLPRAMGRAMFSGPRARELAERYQDELFDAPAQTVLADLEACDLLDLEPRLPGLRVPLTLLVGSEDHLTPPRLSRRLAERAADARVRVLKGVGHLLPLEAPETVTATLEELTKEERAE